MVSVIVIALDSDKNLANCLDSIFMQSYKHIEVIVADMGSMDDTLSILSVGYKNVIVKMFEADMGLGTCLNSAIKEAHGDYVAVVHWRFILEPDWLSNIITFMGKDSRVFSVCGVVLDYDSGRIENAGWDVTLSERFIHRGRGKYMKSFSKTKQIFACFGGAAVYRKSILNDIGLFEERLSDIYYDIDIGFRAMLGGFVNYFVADALAHCVLCFNFVIPDEITSRIMARNKFFIMRKNLPTALSRSFAIFRVIGELHNKVYFGQYGMTSRYIDGIKEGKRIYKKIKWLYKSKNQPKGSGLLRLLLKNSLKYFCKIAF